MQSQFLAQIRAENPLVHNISNIVAANFCANGLLALGASPIMAADPAEVAEVVSFSRALVINLGTLPGKTLETMVLAGQTANALGIPVLLDPVGVAAISARQQRVKALLQAVKFSAIRGNAAELAYLAGASWQPKGVDAGSGSADLAAVCRQLARRYQCVVMMSGAVDIVSDGEQTARLYNGTPMFPKITASGCLLSAVTGAFLAVADQHSTFQAVVESGTTYGVAGEMAAFGLKPTAYGQFQLRLLDSLAAINAEEVEKKGQVIYD